MKANENGKDIIGQKEKNKVKRFKEGNPRYWQYYSANRQVTVYLANLRGDINRQLADRGPTQQHQTWQLKIKEPLRNERNGKLAMDKIANIVGEPNLLRLTALKPKNWSTL